ncbi:MAG: 5'-methylthioadenosine/adenosylhomocysteine nucleosidase [Eubacterium sp.]|nr:5'-methylthioadenosine/adenosylhomocysteine nucleosidase [Eubacterium sp.]
MIGIIGAMPEEVSGLAAQMEQAKETKIAGMLFYSGLLEGKEVTVVQSGVGKVNAGICAYILADHFRADAVINTGIAGSLKNEIDIGDIVISTDTVQHDVDVTVWGYEPGQVPGTGGAAFTADEELVNLAETVCRDCNPEIRTWRGRIVSGDQFISDTEVKDRLVKTFGAYCAEMEGAAVAQACCLSRTPFVILRAICDKADGSAVADNIHFTDEVLKRNDRLIRGMLQRL